MEIFVCRKKLILLPYLQSFKITKGIFNKVLVTLLNIPFVWTRFCYLTKVTYGRICCEMVLIRIFQKEKIHVHVIMQKSVYCLTRVHNSIIYNIKF